MSDQEVDSVKLVCENGREFKFVDTILTTSENEEAKAKINITDN